MNEFTVTELIKEPFYDVKVEFWLFDFNTKCPRVL
jgi:hypothetical protein